LAKAGFGGGNPETIANMPSKWVVKMLEYNDFCSNYETEYQNLNTDNG
jgi:hypothetical protein